MSNLWVTTVFLPERTEQEMLEQGQSVPGPSHLGLGCNIWLVFCKNTMCTCVFEGGFRGDGTALQQSGREMLARCRERSLLGKLSERSSSTAFGCHGRKSYKNCSGNSG